jgi:cell division control protein 45
MLNMGSILSLPDFFTSALDPMPNAHILPTRCHIHLIDSHRPYNLDNLFATSTINERLHVWDDGEVEERLGREEKAYSALEFLDEYSSEEESEDDEEDQDDEEEGDEDGPRKRTKRSSEGVSVKHWIQETGQSLWEL